MATVLLRGVRRAGNPDCFPGYGLPFPDWILLLRFRPFYFVLASWKSPVTTNCPVSVRNKGFRCQGWVSPSVLISACLKATHGSTLPPWPGNTGTPGFELRRVLQQSCLHARAEGLPSASALRPGVQRSTLPSSSAITEGKVLESQQSTMFQTQSC